MTLNIKYLDVRIDQTGTRPQYERSFCLSAAFSSDGSVITFFSSLQFSVTVTVTEFSQITTPESLSQILNYLQTFRKCLNWYGPSICRHCTSPSILRISLLPIHDEPYSSDFPWKAPVAERCSMNYKANRFEGFLKCSYGFVSLFWICITREMRAGRRANPRP